VFRDAEQIVRFWQAVEVFSPQPLPGPNLRENVTDVRPGDPMPWEAGGRLAARPPAAGKVWRHQVFGGVFDLSGVGDALRIVYGDDQVAAETAETAETAGTTGAGRPPRGQSALFACTLDADGVLDDEPAISRCAQVLGDIVADDAAAGGPTAAAGESGALAGRPLSGDDLRDFAARLAERLGVAALLQPRGLRVRSYQAPAGAGEADEPPGRLLRSSFDSDLGLVAGALRAGSGGAALAAFLGGGAAVGMDDSQDDPDDGAGRGGRIDVRREPLVVRDGCAPGQIPPGRWPAAGPLARSEQFAVNEIIRSPGLFAVHAPPGTGTVPVFSDLVAAIVVERGRRLAQLPSPAAAFGRSRSWGPHAVRAPVPALTGFEIVLAAPGEDTRLADIGERWRDSAAETDYFPATARLADSDGTWALITARLGDRADRRAFVERFWHGTVRGTDVLFRAGESMPAALRRLKNEAVSWPAAVARFRTALAEVSALSSERTVAAAAITRLSHLEHACEQASRALEAAEQRCADLTEREPELRDNLVTAEERRRASLADLAARRQEDSVPGATLAGRLRAGFDWVAARGSHQGLRSACAEATRQRDAALRDEQALRAGLAGARQAVAAAEAAAAKLASDMARLQEPVTQARQRWGDQVPDGPSQAETDDAALIERREKSPAWADEEYTAARTELFLAALALHKALIAAEAETFERDLGALMDLLSSGGEQPPEVALAAWQSFFLVVPVVRVAFEDVGSLFAGLGRGSVGWLLAAAAGRLAPQQVLGGLWRASQAVLAGDAEREEPTVVLPRAGRQALAEARGAAGGWAPGLTSAQLLADRTARYGTWLPAGAGDGDGIWVGTPLCLVRASPTTAGDWRDGLLVPGAPDRDRIPLPIARRPALNGNQLHVHPGCADQGQQVARVGGEDVVPVLGEAHHGRVDGVRDARAGQQHPGAPAQGVIHGNDFHAVQQPGNRNRAASPATPYLRDDRAIGERDASRHELVLHPGGNVAFTAFGGYEGAGVQDQHQSVPVR
jgi:hypothetical protein